MSETATPPATPPAAERFVSTSQRVRGRGWAMRLLGVFSSMKTAACLIAAVAIVVGGATLYETRYGRDATAVMVYQQAWFAGVFLLLAVNIFGAAAVRWPWRRNQTGFVIVHAGLLTLILGFFLAGNDRLDGSLVAPPGREVADIQLPRDSVTIALDERRSGCELQTLAFAGYPSFARFLLGQVAPWWFPLGDPTITNQHRPVPLLDEHRDGVALRLLAVCDTARQEVGFLPASENEPAEPAVRLALSARTPMSPTPQPLETQWLAGGERAVASVGPLTATLSLCADPRAAEDFIACAPVTAERGVVRAYWHGLRYEAEVPATLPAMVELAPDLALEFKRYVPRPRVQGDQLTDDATAAVDPFVMLRIGTGDVAARAWHDHVLSAYHLLPPPPNGPDLLYEHPALRAATPATAGPAGMAGWLQLLACPDGKLRLRWFTRTHGLGGTATVESTWSGDLVGGENGPMQLRAAVDWLPRATQGPQPVTMQPEHKDQATRWIEVEAERAGHRGRAWIARGEAKAIALDDGAQILARYDVARYSLKDRHGFALKLERFDEGKDPGGEHSASFASEVSVRPLTEEERTAAERRLADGARIAEERMRSDALGRWLPPALASWLSPTPSSPPKVEAQQARISMNEPLRVGGVTLYQSSFFPESDEHGEPTGRQISVFTVAQDRGRWAKYLGSVLLVAGILTMYVMRVRRARSANTP